MMNTDWKIMGIRNNVFFIDFNALLCYLIGHKSVSWDMPNKRKMFQCRRCGKTWSKN